MSIPQEPSQSPYHSAHPPVPNAGGPSAPAVAPRQVVWGYWLYIVAAILSILSCIVTLANVGNARAALEEQVKNSSQKLPAGTVDALINFGIITAVVFAVIWVVLFALFAVFMRRGAGWARVVLLIVTILSFVNVISGLGFGLAQVVAAIIATILIWLKPATEYFHAVKARKAVNR